MTSPPVRDVPPPPADDGALRAIVEALVFAAEEPVTIEDLRELLPSIEEGALRQALDELGHGCEAPDRGVRILPMAGGYRMVTKPELAEWVRALFRSRNRRRLSGAALETLAIVAYRQPITTPEIQALRGTEPTGVFQNPLRKKLLPDWGRKKVVGKPVLYGTTRDFLTHFGLNSLADLPTMEEFGGMVASPIPAGPEPERPPGFEEDGNGRPGEDEEFEDDDQEESEREDDGDDS